MFFICFIVSFIIDITAVSKNSHLFESNDLNQVIPRVISLAIILPFAVYEFVNMIKNFKSYWNLNDLLLISIYSAYFTMTFCIPVNEYALKSLQLVIVTLSFIKVS